MNGLDLRIADLARDLLLTTLLLAGPVLLVGLVVGIAVSLFQALTSVQEMTLTFVPKLLGAAILLTFVGNWTLQKLVAFTIVCFEHAARVTG